MTSPGFEIIWDKAIASYRNAPHGRKSAAWKRLRDLVAQELRKETER